MSGPALISPNDDAARIKHFHDAPVEYLEEILGIPAWTLAWSLVGDPNRGAGTDLLTSPYRPEWEESEFYRQEGGRIITDTSPDPYANHVWTGDKDPLYHAAQAIAEGARRTVVYGGVGTSKTFSAAALGLWYLDTRRPKRRETGGTKVVGLAPVIGQLQESWLAEVFKHLPRFKELHPNAERVGDYLYVDRGQYDKNWCLFARAAAVKEGEDSATVAQGLHAANMLIFFEEYPGIKPAVWAALKKTVSDETNQIFVVGNPKFRGDALEKLKDTPGVRAFHACALDHPSYVTDLRLVPGGVSRVLEQDLLNDAMQELGTDDPEEAKKDPHYTVAILGLWPETSADAYIKTPHILAAEKGLKKPVFEFEHALPLEGFTRVYYEAEAQDREGFEGAATHRWRYWVYTDLAGSDDITDATRGDKNSRDYHACIVYDALKKRICAVAHTRGPQDRHAQICLRLCSRFALPYPKTREEASRGKAEWTGRAWPSLAWERQGVGASFHTHGWGNPSKLPPRYDRYENTDAEGVPRTEDEIGPLEFATVRKYKQLYRKIVITKKAATETQTLGHDTNSSSAGGSLDAMMAELLAWAMTFRAFPDRLAAREVLDEMRTLVRIPPKTESQKEKIKAQDGCHDDLLLATAGALFVSGVSAQFKTRTPQAVAFWTEEEVAAAEEDRVRHAAEPASTGRDAYGQSWKSSYR